MPSEWYLKSTYPVSFPSDPLLFVTDEAFKIDVILDPTITKPMTSPGTPETDDPCTPLSIWKRQLQRSPGILTYWAKVQEEVDSVDKSSVRQKETDLSLLFGAELQVSKWWHSRLPLAWYEMPSRAMAVLMYWRARNFGTGDRYPFYLSCGAIYLSHPKTFLQFVKRIGQPIFRWVPAGDIPGAPEPAKRRDGRLPVTEGVPFGYWKDALNLLVLAVNDTFYSIRVGDFRKVLNQYTHRKPRPYTELPPDYRPEEQWYGQESLIEEWVEDDEAMNLLLGDVRFGSPNYIDKEDEDYESENEKMPLLSRKDILAFRHDRAVDKFKNDPVYRAFHLTVARMFAGQLKEDLKTLDDALQAGTEPMISHCAKWAPSHNRSHDRSTFIVSSIAEIMFPEALYAHELESAGLTEQNEKRRTRYLWLARMAYAKALTRLRKFSGNLPEKISAAQDILVDYSTIHPKIMMTFAQRFLKNDSVRFQRYLRDVGAGEQTLLLGDTSPGEILTTLLDIFPEPSMIGSLVARLQWEALVKKTRGNRNDETTMVVCMTCRRSNEYYVNTFKRQQEAIALTMLMMDCMDDSWNSQIIQCGDTLEWVEAPEAESLKLRYELFDAMPHANYLDCVKLYEELLLPRLLTTKAAGQPIPKKVIIFSPMTFAEVQSPGQTYNLPPVVDNPWSKSYDRLKALFAQHGLEIPILIYWYFGREGSYPGMDDAEGVKFIFDESLDCTRAFIEGADIESMARSERKPEPETWFGRGGQVMDSTRLMELGLMTEGFNLEKSWD